MPHPVGSDLAVAQCGPWCGPPRSAAAQRGANGLASRGECARGKGCLGVRTVEEARPEWRLGRSRLRQRGRWCGAGLTKGLRAACMRTSSGRVSHGGYAAPRCGEVMPSRAGHLPRQPWNHGGWADSA